MLNIVICPGCGIRLPKRNHGCRKCAYEFGCNDGGRIGTIEDIMNADGITMDEVCPAFIRGVVLAAQEGK